MKKRLFLVPFLLYATASFAQIDCEGYFPFKEGASMEYTNYDKKGKETGRQENTITEIHDIDGGLEAVMSTKLFDEKNENVLEGSFLMQCKEDMFYVDMSNMLPAEMMDAYGDAEMEITGEFMEFPKNPKAGQTLPDGDMQVAILMSGMNMNISVHVTDRLIEGFETVTTPAGTFDCMRYSESSEVKMIFTIRGKSVTWYAEDIGMVKNESYDDKGKLQGSMLLTKLKQ